MHEYIKKLHENQNCIFSYDTVKCECPLSYMVLNYWHLLEVLVIINSILICLLYVCCFLGTDERKIKLKKRLTIKG